jgi:hypothetical protein
VATKIVDKIIFIWSKIIMKVYPPNIYLFAFYQKQANGTSPDNANWLWNNGNHIVSKALGTNNFQIQDFIHTEIDSDISYLELAKNDSDYKELIQDNIILDGISIDDKKIYLSTNDLIFAVRGYESYGLGISLRCRECNVNKKIQIEEIQSLNPDNCFILEDNPRFLGQTLLIIARLSPEDKNKKPEALKNLADEYLKHFFPEDEYKSPVFNQAGTLFNCPIFEYGIFRQLTTYRHILVWFLDDEDTETEKKLDVCYKQFFDLFCFRAEVINAYKRSISNSKEAKKQYLLIKDEVQKLAKVNDDPLLNFCEIKLFNDLIIKLSQMSVQYTDVLRRIEYHQNRNFLNTRNYNDKVTEIKSIYPYDNFRILTDFTSKTARYFQSETAAELQYFHSGFGLIDKAISSVRAQIAIGQAEREREQIAQEQEQKGEQERLILALGTGIAAGGNWAGSYQSAVSYQFPSESQNTANFSVYHFGVCLSTSFIFGLCISFLVWKMFPRVLKFQENLLNNKLRNKSNDLEIPTGSQPLNLGTNNHNSNPQKPIIKYEEPDKC